MHVAKFCTHEQHTSVYCACIHRIMARRNPAFFKCVLQAYSKLSCSDSDVGSLTLILVALALNNGVYSIGPCPLKPTKCQVDYRSRLYVWFMIVNCTQITSKRILFAYKIDKQLAWACFSALFTTRERGVIMHSVASVCLFICNQCTNCWESRGRGVTSPGINWIYLTVCYIIIIIITEIFRVA